MHRWQTLDTWQCMYVIINGKMCTNKCNFAFQAELLNPWMQRPQTPFQGSGARLMGSMPGTTSSYHDVIIWGPPFCISCSRNVQCSMNVEDCVISKICNGNSIMVNTVMLENYKVNCWDIWLLCNLIIICNGNSIMINTVMLENYKVNCWDIWLLCNIDDTGPLCLARPTL